MADFGVGVDAITVDPPAGPVFAVAAPAGPTFVAGLPDAASVLIVPISGPAGAPGEPGSPGGLPGPAGAPGQPRYTGTGAPGLIIGAQPGDEYLDDATGNIYRLE